MVRKLVSAGLIEPLPLVPDELDQIEATASRAAPHPPNEVVWRARRSPQEAPQRALRGQSRG
jgi:hypothetical protein